MTTFKRLATLGCAMLAAFSIEASAATIAQWTFESSIPAAAGPFSPETGSGSALGSHSGASTYSSPAGNGSAHSFSSTNWLVGDYYQFSVQTAGFSGISIAWDQTSSNTGPGQFKLAYSTDGTNFTDFSTYTVLANGGTPNPSWNSTTPSAAYSFNQDLSAVTALDNVGGTNSIFFRLIDRSTVSANGATVASGGTDRVDNVTISGTQLVATPLPAAAWLLASGLGFLGTLRRRKAA